MPKTLLMPVFLLLLTCSLGGCTHTRSLSAVGPEQARSELRIGDEVRLTLHSGARQTLRLSAIDDESLSGTNAEGRRYRVPFADIQTVESQRFSAVKTGAAAGVGIVAYAALAAAVMVVMIEAFFGGLAGD
jgi:hypothetical protein